MLWALFLTLSMRAIKNLHRWIFSVLSSAHRLRGVQIGEIFTISRGRDNRYWHLYFQIPGRNQDAGSRSACQVSSRNRRTWADGGFISNSGVAALKSMWKGARSRSDMPTTLRQQEYRRYQEFIDAQRVAPRGVTSRALLGAIYESAAAALCQQWKPHTLTNIPRYYSHV